MSSDDVNNNATNEVTSAEAELRAAQEALDAARARLAELKAENPPLEPGVSVCQPENQSDEVAAVLVNDAASEVEAVVLESEASAAASGVLDDEPVVSSSSAVQAEQDAEESVKGGASAMPASEAEVRSAEFPADESAPTGQQPAPTWVPYSTAPVAAPANAAAAGAPCAYPTGYASSAGPIPPAGVVGAQPQAAPTSPQPTAAQPATPQQPYVGYEPPNYGQTPHAGPGAVPPQQPYYGYQQNYYQPQYAPVVATKDHVAAGLLAIFLGQLGIHKFYLGYNTSGFIMLAVTILGSIFTFGLAAGVMWIIAVIEGIMYLTKSQSEFEQMYVVNKREWF